MPSRSRPSLTKSPGKTRPLTLVAIGASAGGLEAVSEFFKNMEPDTGFAFVYIQHLDPNRKSMLAEILSKVSRMKVQEIYQRTRIRPNEIYIIPPSKDLIVTDGTLKLNPRDTEPYPHYPVDLFFNSLAVKHPHSIGILLSGNGNDGTQGLKAIKLAGGITMAQDDSAKFSGMPHSAISEGVVDRILSPVAMTRELKKYSRKKNIFSRVVSYSGTGEPLAERELKEILKIIHAARGVDFSQYKMTTIRRRILRRMLLHQIDSSARYLDYLRKTDSELDQLCQDLLIYVTSFFRDAEVSEFLHKKVLPQIIRNKKRNEPIRIWIPACSTGEEAFSMAILCSELLGNQAFPHEIQIFATDLSQQAILRARTGIYSPNALHGVSPKRLRSFFTHQKDHYRVVKAVREMCIFAPHNLFKDPPFSKLDLVSCCNLLIYLEPSLQKKVIGIFHYSLNPGGVLVLGKSENVGAFNPFFSRWGKKFKIYTRNKNEPAKQTLELHRRLSDATRSRPPLTGLSGMKRSARIQDPDLEVDQMLLSRFIPASVVVNQDLEILQFRGATATFLEPAPGKASLNLMKMAQPALAFELRTGIHQAGTTRKPVKKTIHGLKINGGEKQVTLEIIPLHPDGGNHHYLVVFREEPATVHLDLRSAQSRDRRIRMLQEELNTARENLRAILEEQENSTQELQSANEEIISSNEELQSINEELETSKEEMESTNEELMTINAELQLRNEQLVESQEYTEAIFSTIRTGVIVLDRDLRLKTANQSFYQMFQLSEDTAEGRLIYELGNGNWDIPVLRAMLMEIQAHDKQFSGFEFAHSFPGIGQKILLFNARKLVRKSPSQQLILVAVEDITERRAGEKLVLEGQTWLHHLADNTPVMIWVAGKDGGITFVNKTWLDFSGRKPEQEAGSGWRDLIHPDDQASVAESFTTALDKKTDLDLEYRMKRADGPYRWIHLLGKPSFNGTAFLGFIGNAVEIHEQKVQHQDLEQKVEERTRLLKLANLDLERSNQDLEQFAFVASHDLKEPLRKMQTFASIILERHGERIPGQIHDFLTKITLSSQRMTRLIDDLLDLSRITQSRERFVVTNLNEILAEVIQDLDQEIASHKARISSSGLPSIWAIPNQMEQLFTNLIGNALKFSRGKIPPRILIRSRKLPSKSYSIHPSLNRKLEYYEIQVQDNGIGLDKKYSDQIFVIFQRLHSQAEYPGTGIGLTLCQKIVNYHGGGIFVKSQIGKGSTFHIILPASKPGKN